MYVGQREQPHDAIELQVELEGFEDFGVMSPSSAAIEDHALMQELKELDRDIDDLHL